MLQASSPLLLQSSMQKGGHIFRSLQYIVNFPSTLMGILFNFFLPNNSALLVVVYKDC